MWWELKDLVVFELAPIKEPNDQIGRGLKASLTKKRSSSIVKGLSSFKNYWHLAEMCCETFIKRTC